jgi:4-amino-4-deoxy-L-arabinose transferase-like glycosyltransferase
VQYSPNSSKSALKAAPFTAAGLLLLCGLFFFWRLDAYTLFDRTETETAEVARQMWISGDWITPIFNGIRYFDKPVLLYWLMGLGFQLFGVGEWAVRLPSALFATALILATWQFGRIQLGPRIALFAATMLLANPFVFGLGRTGVTDMGLAFFVATGLYCWYSSYASGQQLGYLLCAAFLAGGVLIKGPIALLLPGLIIGIFLIYTGRLKAVMTTMPWVRGIGIIAAITLPWYLLVTQANGRIFLDKFFIHHNVDRFLNVVDNQPGPWYYYLLFTPAGFFPWIVFLFIALFRWGKWEWMRPRYWQSRSIAAQLPLFMGLWFVIVTVFLSTASTKLPHYIMPALPALAFLCAQAWEAESEQGGKSTRLGLGFIAIVLMFLGVGFLVALGFINDPALPELRSRVEATGSPWILAGTCFLAAFANILAGIRLQLQWAWGCALGAFCLIFSAATNLLMPALETQVHAPLLDMANTLHKEVRPGDQPATLGVYAPSLNFYGQINRIPVYEKRSQIVYQLTHPERLLLLTTAARLEKNQLDLGAFQPIHTSGIYRLYALPPGAVKVSKKAENNR